MTQSIPTSAAPLTSAPSKAAGVRGRRRSPINRKAPYLFLLPMLVLFVAFKLYPYVYAAWLSLTANIDGENTFVWFNNYARLFRDPLFYTALGNTATILIIQVPLMLCLAIGLAVAFNSLLLKFRSVLRMIYFVPIVMGLVAYGILFRALFQSQFGIVNQFLEGIGLSGVPWLADPFWSKMAIILALTWHYTGQNAIIYLTQIQSIPTELYEAASVDGATGWNRFWHVTVPGLRPALVLTIILSTIGTLQLFDEPYVLTNGGPNNATLTIGLYLYQNGFQFFDFGYASAIGYALVIIIGIVSLIQFRLLKEKDA